MHVVGLYVKPKPGAEMIPLRDVRGLPGLGFEGDYQSHPASPRQVLVFSRRVLDRLHLQPTAVRANVVIDGLVDELPSGTVLRIGESLALRLTLPCEPCRKLDSHRTGLARELVGRRGMLARVVSNGAAKAGDSVSVFYGACRPLPRCWSDRVADIVRCLPDGMWLSYPRLALIAGLQTTYCRAFPGMLRRLRAQPVIQADRVVPAKAFELRLKDDEFWDGASYYQVEEHEMTLFDGRRSRAMLADSQ